MCLATEGVQQSHSTSATSLITSSVPNLLLTHACPSPNFLPRDWEKLHIVGVRLQPRPQTTSLSSTLLLCRWFSCVGSVPRYNQPRSGGGRGNRVRSFSPAHIPYQNNDSSPTRSSYIHFVFWPYRLYRFSWPLASISEHCTTCLLFGSPQFLLLMAQITRFTTAPVPSPAGERNIITTQLVPAGYRCHFLSPVNTPAYFKHLSFLCN